MNSDTPLTDRDRRIIETWLGADVEARETAGRLVAGIAAALTSDATQDLATGADGFLEFMRAADHNDVPVDVGTLWKYLIERARGISSAFE